VSRNAILHWPLQLYCFDTKCHQYVLFSYFNNMEHALANPQGWCVCVCVCACVCAYMSVCMRVCVCVCVCDLLCSTTVASAPLPRFPLMTPVNTHYCFDIIAKAFPQVFA
jgi:hypothetical protein